MARGFSRPKEFTELETRLAASLLYRAMRKREFDRRDRFAAPVDVRGGQTLEELCAETEVAMDLALHAMTWMRFHGVDVRVYAAANEPSVWACRRDVPVPEEG